MEHFIYNSKRTSSPGGNSPDCCHLLTREGEQKKDFKYDTNDIDVATFSSSVPIKEICEVGQFKISDLDKGSKYNMMIDSINKIDQLTRSGDPIIVKSCNIEMLTTSKETEIDSIDPVIKIKKYKSEESTSYPPQGYNDEERNETSEYGKHSFNISDGDYDQSDEKRIQLEKIDICNTLLDSSTFDSSDKMKSNEDFQCKNVSSSLFQETEVKIEKSKSVSPECESAERKDFVKEDASNSGTIGGPPRADSPIDCIIFKSIGINSQSIKRSLTPVDHLERSGQMKNKGLSHRLERSKKIEQMSHIKVCSKLNKLIELISLHKEISLGVDAESGIMDCERDNYTSEEYHQCMNLIKTIGTNHTVEHQCDCVGVDSSLSYKNPSDCEEGRLEKTPHGSELFWKPIIMGYCRLPLIENILHLINPFDALAPLSRMLSCTLTGMFSQQRERQFTIVNIVLDWLERKIPNELCRYSTEKEGFSLLHCIIYGSISLVTIPSDGGYSIKERWYSGWSDVQRTELIDRLISLYEICEIKIDNSSILAFTDCYTGYFVEKARYERFINRQIDLPKNLSDVIWTVMDGRRENWPSFIPSDLYRGYIGISVLYQLVMEDRHDQLRRILPLIEHINCYTYDYKDRSFEPLIPRILRGAARRIRDKNTITILNFKIDDCTLGDLKSLAISLQLLMDHGADPSLPIKYSYTNQYHTTQDYLQHYGYLYPGSRIEKLFIDKGIIFRWGETSSLRNINWFKSKVDDDIPKIHFNRDRIIRYTRSIYNEKRHHGPFKRWCKQYKYIKYPSLFRQAYDDLKEIYKNFEYNLKLNIDYPYKIDSMFDKNDFVDDPWLTRLKYIYTDNIFIDRELPTI